MRPYWSRTTLLTVTAVSTIVLFWACTAWLDRSQTRTVELSPSSPHRLVSDIGPIQVSHGQFPSLEYRASWLLRGPTESVLDAAGPGDGPGVGLACNTVTPCRASSKLNLPADTDLRIFADDNDVSIDRFDGDLKIEVSGDGEVFLGPISGRAVISTAGGGVFGYGLTVDELEIETTTGEIELRFATRPERLTVRSGSEPVTIELPDGDYAVSVKSGSSMVIAVGQAESADSEIFVQARGPVRINPHQ